MTADRLADSSSTTTSLYSRWGHRLVNSERCKRESWPPLPRAHKAILKRCATLEEVMLTEAFQHLWLSQSEGSRTSRQMELCALVAWVFAAVKEDTDTSLAKAMAERAEPESDRPRVSQLRFQQLVAARSVEEFAGRLRRIVVQLKGRVSLDSLAADVSRWYWQAMTGERVANPAQRQTLRWAMEYYKSMPQK